AWVVRSQAQLAGAAVAQDLAARAVVAVIHLEAEGLVGLDRVHPPLLQLVGAKLVQQPDAAPLLLHVEDHAPALPLYLLHGHGQLIAAVAPHRTEYVARHALRVHADEHRLILPPLPFDEGEVRLVRDGVFISDELEIARRPDLYGNG